METTIREFEHLWTTDCDKYVLVRLGGSVSGYGILERRTHMSLVIEDDDVYREVIQRMLGAGVAVVAAVSEA